MSLVKLVSNYSAFNEWANTQILDWLQTLDVTFLYQNSPSSYPSIDLTLQHILRAQKFWFQFINEFDTSHFNWAANQNQTEKNAEELRVISTAMKESFSTFNESQLLKLLQLNMPWAKNECCRYEYIIHVVNHSSFHRGQIVSIARNLGISSGVPNTDYNIFNCK